MLSLPFPIMDKWMLFLPCVVTCVMIRDYRPITNGAFRLGRACLDLSSHPIWHLASNLINLFLTSRDVSGIDWFMADCQQVWSVDGYSRNVVVRVALSSEIRSAVWWLFLHHMTHPLLTHVRRTGFTNCAQLLKIIQYVFSWCANYGKI